MSGLNILSATYGTSSQSEDVTQIITGLVKDGILNLSVSTHSLNVEDPAPGQIKTLKITYTINGGSSTTIEEIDGGSISLNAPPERHASGLQIKKAEYGVDGNMTDVTDAVRRKINKGSINLKVGFSEVGLPDPNPQKQKHLSISYTINGAENSKKLKDGEVFNVSAPAMSSSSTEPLSDDSEKLMTLIKQTLVKFVLWFLYGISIKACYDFGSHSSIFGSNGWLFGVLAAVLPYFAFWGLPIVVLIARTFYNSDFTALSSNMI
jgi:hypothetical protein